MPQSKHDQTLKALSYGVVPGGMTSGMTGAMFLSVQDRRELLHHPPERGNQVLQRELPEAHDVTDSASPLRKRVASARYHSIACSAAERPRRGRRHRRKRPADHRPWSY